MATRSVTTIASIGVLIVLSIGAVAVHHAYAQTTTDGRGQLHKTSPGFGPHRLFKFIHRLDLDREQREQIGEIMDRHRPVMRTYMLDMMDAKKELQAILSSAEYDPQAIESLAQVQAKNTEAIFVASAKTFAEVAAILTIEQRQKLAERMDKRHGRHGWRHGWGRHHEGPPRDGSAATEETL